MMKQYFALILIYSCLFPRFILAALQNVTVDDAVLTGAVVPQYLPAASTWNIGNDRSSCYVQPDPSQAYNGTWHDATYFPSNNYTQTIQFTFTGSALYIFFILANNVTSAATFTNVTFNLDGNISASFQHNPTASTAYEYNQPVYANDSLTYGQHTMTIEPVNSGTDVLMLFDYLIYTEDAGTTTTSTDSAVATILPTIPATTQTPSGSSGTSSGSNTGAIVGGVVAGVVVVLVAAYALCYRPHKKRKVGRSVSANATTVEPFVISPQTDPMASGSSSLPVHQIPWGSPLTTLASESQSKATRGTSPPIVQQSVPPSTVLAPSTASGTSSGGGGANVLEQVGLLRDEVARLRELQTGGVAELDSEAPPEYYQ
ncbi:hypothetical protein JVU11DRAFT_11905 [Chiua virens]|nr:hypothetical protein JVU11DRAFT_11905 [Chiua virens]